MVPKSHRELPTIGWREWVALPALGIATIKTKVNTGARSSAIHAFGVSVVRRGGRDIVQFQLHPLQHNAKIVVPAEAELIEYRHVRNSGGQQMLRPVILTELALGDQVWTIELTLAGRDAMGFRMLLGREALRRRFLVNPGRSYLVGRPDRDGRIR